MKKIEVDEDYFKKLVLMVKLSKAYVNLPPQDLQLSNLWRVAPKLADKLIAKAGMVLIQNKGKLSLKYASEVPQGAVIIGQGYVAPLDTQPKSESATEQPTDEPADVKTEALIEQPVETPAEQPAEQVPTDATVSECSEVVPPEKQHRCRKRKNH